MHIYTYPFIPIHTYNNIQQIMLLLNMLLQICNFLSAHTPSGGGLRQRVGIIYLAMYICMCVCLYLLILLQFCQSRGGIVSSLYMSQFLRTSHSMVFCLGLDDYSSTVTQCAVLFSL